MSHTHKTGWEEIFDEWEECPIETLEHVVTVIMCMMDDETDKEGFNKAVEYLGNWVKYRSQFSRNISNYHRDITEKEVTNAVNERVREIKKEIEEYAGSEDSYGLLRLSSLQELPEDNK